MRPHMRPHFQFLIHQPTDQCLKAHAAGISNMSDSEQHKNVLMCPSDLVGRLVGNRGNMIKVMESASGARIWVGRG